MCIRDRNYVLYVIAICSGAVITHSLVAPTPGPLIMAETLKINLGLTILAGIVAGIIPSILALRIGKIQDKKLNIPVRQTNTQVQIDNTPSLFVSVLPILLPVLLISSVSILGVVNGSVPTILEFLGNKNIACLLYTSPSPRDATLSRMPSSA